MKVPTMRNLAVALALVGAVALTTARAADTAPAAPATSAEQTLRRAADYYARQSVYAGLISCKRVVVLKQETKTSEMALNVTFERPNRLRLELADDGKQFLLMVSNGETLWILAPDTAKYLQKPAPKSVTELLQTPPLAQAITGDLRRVTLSLLEPDPYEVLVDRVVKIEPLSSQQGDGGPVEGVHLITDAAAVDLHVDPASGAIVKARLTPTLLLARMHNPKIQDMFIEVTHTPAAPPADPGSAFAFQPPEGARQATGVRDLFTRDFVGRPAPDFELPGLKQEETWRLSEHKGKVVALDFWATWCGPCKKELPQLAGIHQDLRDRGFLLIAVNQREKPDKVTAFLKGTRLDVPVAMDHDGRVGGLYGVDGIPRLVLIGRDGVIKAVHEGYAPGLERDIRRQIEQLLAGQELSARQ